MLTLRALFVAAVLAVPFSALAADDAAPGTNSVQAGDREIEACLAESRAQAPDLASHDRRIVMTTQCICSRVANLCRQGMIQDGRLRQRVLDDK